MHKTAYSMRISDWCSDVCSSDLADRIRCAAILLVLVHPLLVGGQAQIAGDVERDLLAGFGGKLLVEIDRVLMELPDAVAHVEQRQQQIGRASCRERVCQYV